MLHALKKLFASPRKMGFRERELVRRRREMTLAALAFGFALILTWILFYLFDTGSALFIAVFSLNFLLLLGVAVVVIRNALKLVLERRRGVLGSRLRTRLTLSFVALTLAPCILMFLITTKFVQLSVDFWFKDQITTSMESALEVGRADYDKTGRRLHRQGQQILGTIRGRSLVWGSEQMDAALRAFRDGERLALVGTWSSETGTGNWHANRAANRAWEAARRGLNWESLHERGFQAILESGGSDDFVIAVLAVDAGTKAYLVLGESMGEGYKAKLDRIAGGAREYRQLWTLKRALKWILYAGLGVLTLLIILGAMWFGFRVAKEISAPVLAIAQAAQLIAKGDLTVRVASNADDELGVLSESFNQMAVDLEASRQHLTGANELLAEQNLRIAEHSQYMAAVLDNIGAGVISLDTEGVVNMANRAAGHILDHPAEELVGRKLIDLMPQAMRPMTVTILEQFRRRPFAQWQRQITLPFSGRERRLMVNAAGLVTPEGDSRGLVAVFEDISEMERMQRLAAWREVATRIAHEIKNPLTPIKLSAQRLQRKFGSQVDDPVFSQSTEMIVRQVEALQYMVSEFSSFAKLPEINPRPGQLGPMLTDLTDFFRNSHSSIAWNLTLPDIPTILMDRDTLYRAFMNLFSNAAEVLRERTDGRVDIVVSLDTARHRVRVDVADNGPGLDGEDADRMFEPYYSRKKGGTGLGLTIVKSIISDHKGYIRAENGSKGGAVFTVELPIG